jgi:hypothetical protein
MYQTDVEASGDADGGELSQVTYKLAGDGLNKAQCATYTRAKPIMKLA